MTQVAIFGGGMGGLAAAHELIERGFEVDVYEKRHIWGGKARSYGVKGTGTDRASDLPGEHGFRFFPGFYKHIPNTMSRIPGVGGRGTVADSLVQCTAGEFLLPGKRATIFPVRFPRSWQEFKERLHELRSSGGLGFEPGDLRHFAWVMFRAAIACQARRMAVFEKTSWWDYTGAQQRSAPYQNLLARGLTRSLVAMRAESASTRTVADIMLQMVYYTLTPGASSDRVLNGPTSAVWIDPWRAHLEQSGVRFHPNTPLEALALGSDRHIASATVREQSGETRTVTADHYVAALPCDVMQPIVAGPLADAAPSLRGIPQLYVEWMNGVQFYLRRDYPMVFGHTIFADSNWSLTSISQPQFWKDGPYPMHRFGDGQVQGLLSVDISDWTKCGKFTTTEPAERLSRDDVVKEVWAQIQAHVADSGFGPLDDADKLAVHLDHDIDRHPEPGHRHAQSLRGRMTVAELHKRRAAIAADPTEPLDVDTEPLLVNTCGSWACRPEATTEIPNLFLASDYVRTCTDLATMEGANEAGRRAVNGILAVTGSRAPRCQVWPLKEPWILAPFRALDWVLFRLQGGGAAV
jgi:uncharacterized protein with NAD-binding domain and iron-sulfur cluster